MYGVGFKFQGVGCKSEEVKVEGNWLRDLGKTVAAQVCPNAMNFKASCRDFQALRPLTSGNHTFRISGCMV